MKAEDLKLGTCIVGAFDADDVRKLLSIPERAEPEMILTLGYPETWDKDVERIPVNLVTYFDEYGKKSIIYDPFPLKKQVKKLEKIKEKGVKKSLEMLAGLKEKIVK